MQLDYRCYVHFRDAAAFDRALDLLTVKTTAGAFPFRKLAETFSNMKAMTKAMDTPLGQVFDTVTAPRNEQFLFIHDHYKNLQTYMAMTEEIFDELYEEDPNSFLMIADVTNFDDDSLGDVVWYYLGGKDYTRFIDPDMERHGIELSDWKGMLAGQPLTQAQKDWAQRITGGCQPQNMMAHFPMETTMKKTTSPIVREYKIGDITYIVKAVVKDGAKEDAVTKVRRLIQNDLRGKKVTNNFEPA